MTYRSDRQRVEALILPQMLLGVLLTGVNDPEHPDALAAKKALLEASNEAFSDLREPARSKIIRRAHRVHPEVMARYEKQGQRLDKIGLIVFFLLKAITDCDYMQIGEGPMQTGVDLMLSALEPAAEITPMLQSAQKQTRKVLDHLQRLGYYQGVPLDFAA